MVQYQKSKIAQGSSVPAVKEPVSLMGTTNGLIVITLLPCVRGKPMTWDVTVPDTHANSHIGKTSTKPGLAGHKAAQNKSDKYARLNYAHIFYLFATETAGT